jgi:hypothetical protein
MRTVGLVYCKRVTCSGNFVFCYIALEDIVWVGQAAFGANYPRFTPSMLNGDYYHFVDQDLSAGVPYRYQVQAEFLDGAFSPMSSQVIVVY